MLLSGAKLREFRNQFNHWAIQKHKKQTMPHHFTLGNKNSLIAFTFPIATIKLMAVRVKDIYSCIATN